MSSIGYKPFSIEYGIDTDEAFTRVEQEALYTDAIDRRPYWGGYTKTMISPSHPCLLEALSLFEKEGIKTGTAIDVGCGISLSSIALLDRNWNVIAVDYSQEALDNFREFANTFNPDWIKKGQLTLVHASAEEYLFPEHVTLIIASSICYFNPLKIRKIWDNIHASLQPGGRFVGSFFPRNFMDIVMRAISGQWFADSSTISALIESDKYRNETSRTNTSNLEICFVSKKREREHSSAPALFSIHRTSYYDAVRSLPSKKFSHLFPYAADLVADVRELCTFTSIASAIVTVASSALQADTTFSKYVFAGSVAA
ncbi:MAG: class I SAM-dependent methyltransferase, partial [Verrucomicrobia bacterium]|nr:class I SAM-dependent methyltransferase [Verrucomicrobiota bacterium]